MDSRRTFVPRLEALEDRWLPSSILGGSAVQLGSVLNVAVTNPANAVFIFEDGKGDVAVTWNGVPFQFFHGVNNIQVAANGRANAVFFLNLAPLTAPEQLSLSLTGIVNVFFEHVTPGGAPLTTVENPPVFTLHF
jgi:hypothetical protein